MVLDEKTVIDISDLSIQLYSSHLNRWFKAVDGINLSVKNNSKLAIVGESGCGKSITAMSILKLINANTAKLSGIVKFNGENLIDLDNNLLGKIRGNRISMIFQDPMSSLNPVRKIKKLMIEPLLIHTNYSKKEALQISTHLLEQVKIKDPINCLNSYPHELSGGMRQRVMIAIALSTKPDLIIADEPTTSLDVSVQKDILEIFEDRLNSIGTSTIIISHDISLVSNFADYISVMYAGRIVETGKASEILSNPKHPYTLGLIQSTCKIDDRPKTRFQSIPGNPPKLDELPIGCSFQYRCSRVSEICKKSFPISSQQTSYHSTSYKCYNPIN